MVSKFPHDFRPLIHPVHDTNIILLGSTSLQKIRKCVGFKELTTLKLSLSEGIEYWLALKGFHVYTSPERRSLQSQALYVARSAEKMDGLLLQLLPPFVKTSCHHHTKKREAVHVIHGVAILITSQGAWTLYRGDTHIIEPNVIHQTRTSSQSAIILIEVVGDPEGLGMQDYVYDH